LNDEKRRMQGLASAAFDFYIAATTADLSEYFQMAI
jgi:hypothetical protein